MKVFVSPLSVICFIGLDIFFNGLIILLGIMHNWEEMEIYYICMVLYPIIMYIGFSNVWYSVTIKENTVHSKVPFFLDYELDCRKTIYYLRLQNDPIESKKRVKDFVLISYSDLHRLPPEKQFAWKCDLKTQIVIPYTTKTAPLLDKWLYSDNWICCSEAPPNLDSLPVSGKSPID